MLSAIPIPAILAALTVTLAIPIAAMLFATARRDARLTARIKTVCGNADEEPSRPSVTAAQLLHRVGTTIVHSGILPVKTRSDLEGTLVAAGYRAGSALPLFVGAKVLLIALLPAVAWSTMRVLEMNSPPRLIVAAAMAALGLLLPDMVIRRLRKRYLLQVERGLGDALDLLIICAEAGLPLEAGIERVAVDFRGSNRPTAGEFEQIGQEMKILPDRRQALLNAGKRTGLEGLARLGATLAQSMQYGTPLAQALRTLAAESRAAVLNRFEARAARLSVLLTLPMIVFILPCLFIVVGTPAAVQVMSSFANH
jgi:tight adherence protein C